MRIIFFGSSGFSVPALRSIAGRTVCVVTKKGKPKGRGYALDDNEVKKTAAELGLPLIEIDSFKDDVAKTLPQYNPDLFVVASFGLIIPRWVLDIPSKGPVNIHPSLLPQYRGASPMQWAILSGDEMTGITLIRMNEKMDEGNIIYQEQVKIREGENFIELSERLAHRVGETLPDILDTIESQEMIRGTEQCHEIATYTPIITKEMGRIDWSKNVTQIDRQIRAFVSWPTAHTSLDGKLMKVFDARPDKREEIIADPGTIAGIAKEGISVNTARGILIIKDLQMQGKKRVKAYDFAQGYRDLVGKVLS